MDTIYIGNLDPRVTTEELFRLCEEVGPVASVRIPKNKRRGMSSTRFGFGFCTFLNTQDVQRAFAILGGRCLYGEKLRIGFPSMGPHEPLRFDPLAAAQKFLDSVDAPESAPAPAVDQIPSYLLHLEKHPMTGREKFMSYKVARLEAKLEKKTEAVDKFRTAYRDLVYQLTCPFCQEPAPTMVETVCCSALACDRCALLPHQKCPACRKPGRWQPSPAASRIAGTLRSACPLGCGEEFRRAELPRHMDDVCPSALVTCPHASCGQKMRRRQLEGHVCEGSSKPDAAAAPPVQETTNDEQTDALKCALM
jgi:hypothetical protein